ncbi:cyclin-like protein [Entophlyctis helioformis]|nr:cyclin-like protein [Entophlyctis helioformis]
MALQTRTPAARLTSKSTILKDLGQQLGVRDLEQLARHIAAASWTRIPKSVSAPASLLAADYFDSLAGPVPQASRRVSRTGTATQWWYAPAERDPDILLVAEYADDIYAHLRYMETRTRPPVADYMAALQPHLSWGMRQQLLCWLIQVHNRFRLVPETLFLAVNVVDRFLGLKAGVALDKLQLVGVTALLLAAKFEETLVPPVSDLVYMVDGAYTADEILHAERFMLRVLAFEMGAPGPYGFVRRISAADRYDGSVRNVAKFFLEVGMLDSRLVAVVSSHLAAAAMFLAAKVAYEAPWTAAHEQASGYTEQQLLPCVYMLLEDVSGLCRLVQQQTQHKTQSVQAGTGTGTTGGSGGCADGGSDSDGLVVVYDKYAGDKYGRVSLHVHDFLRRMSLV